MTLNSIPGYAIRSYLKMIGVVRHSSHPMLSTAVLKELPTLKLMGSALLTKEVVEFLETQTLKELWRRINLCEQIHPIPPCPETEKLPYIN